jgi:RNA polymerase sigma factor (sigma-70 family)
MPRARTCSARYYTGGNAAARRLYQPGLPIAIFSCPILQIGGCICAKAMQEDRQLLERFAKDRSESAFGELVNRYVNLVHSTALRRTNFDFHLAHDVAQLVFTDLARKAPSLPRHIMLGGWLHRATLYAAAQLMRSNRRRTLRELEAAAMSALESETAPEWQAIRPALDEALDKLNRTDRDALFLRYFEQRSLAEIGSALGTNEDAAGKRVKRALEKLRAMLARRGITTTAIALSTAISANAVQIAPAGLAATLTHASLAGAASATGFTATLLKFMALTKTQLTVGGIAIAALTASLVAEHNSQAVLRRENVSLQQRITQLNSDNQSLAGRLAQQRTAVPHLPAPSFQVSQSSASDMDTLQSTNFYNRLKDKDFKLKPEQVESYLRSSGRNAASLLAAYRTTSDPALLSEAMRNFPDDPQVAFEAALRRDATPDEQRHWIDILKKSAPDNALGDYLSALGYLKTGQTDQAVKEFMAATGKGFGDYTSERYQDDMEAYLAAGYSVADAKFAAGTQLLLPQLQQTRDVGVDMIDLAKSYQQAGDNASAQAALQMVIDLGARYANSSPGEPAVSQLVGMALQIKALSAMDPNAPYGSTGLTVGDQLSKIQQQKQQVQQISAQTGQLMPMMSEQDWTAYHDRWLMFGEQNAENWVIAKYGQNSTATNP